MTPTIGFLIIGAQKAGTTSLFEYMRFHPQIHMPPEKEIAFFNGGRRFDRGWDWYRARLLQNAPHGAVCGEASTYYMSGSPYGDLLDNERVDPRGRSGVNEPLEEVVPQRIKEFLPDVKLICILRDPVARAYSAYRMLVLERAESRSFDEAISQLLVHRALEQARAVPTLINGYIVMGEYFRVLAGFLRVFPREQLLVILSSELDERPADTLAASFDFVGVAADFVPDNLDTRYRAGAVEGRIPGLHPITWQTKLSRVRSARALWHALPEPARRGLDRVSYRVRLWNGRRGEVADDMSPPTRVRLENHFRADSEALSDLLGIDIPWLVSRPE